MFLILTLIDQWSCINPWSDQFIMKWMIMTIVMIVMMMVMVMIVRRLEEWSWLWRWWEQNHWWQWWSKARPKLLLCHCIGDIDDDDDDDDYNNIIDDDNDDDDNDDDSAARPWLPLFHWLLIMMTIVRVMMIAMTMTMMTMRARLGQGYCRVIEPSLLPILASKDQCEDRGERSSSFCPAIPASLKSQQSWSWSS